MPDVATPSDRSSARVDGDVLDDPRAQAKLGTRQARGPGERHLENLTARVASLLRAIMLGLCGLFGLVAYDSFAAVMVGVLAAALTALSWSQIRLRAIRPLAAIAANATLAAAVGMSQLHLGAEPFSGWVVVTASIMSVTCYFEWPDRAGGAHLIAGTTVLAYTGGCLLAGGELPVLAGGRMVVQAGLAYGGLQVVRRAARVYDTASQRLAARRGAAAAARARRDADRAYLATLHDTASTTFLIVSTGATEDFDWLSAQARRDLEVLTTKWSSARELNLAVLLSTLTGYPELTVRTDLPDTLTLPAEPALAIYQGAREALSNVRRHAGDPNATVTAHEHDGRIEVRVSDRGRGFEPGRVPPHRRGLSHSIRARMVAAGGEVDIHSAPGRGTSVTWCWSRD